MPSLLSWVDSDGKLIFAARIVRSFSYGFLSIILAIYLRLIGLDDILIGVVLSATLVNSVLLTLVASFYADKLGRRKILLIYAAMMSLSGAIFLLTENYVALVAAALVGTINVTGTETGSFLSVEQAILPQTVTDSSKRNTAYAVYNMVGTFAMSGGILLAGLPSLLQNFLSITQADSMRPLFLLYIILGIAVLAMYSRLTRHVELATASGHNEGRPKSRVGGLSHESQRIVGKLSGLFAVDAFAGGFVIQSIVSFWFFIKFGVDLATLSYIFSIAGVLTAFSFLAAAKMADRIGLVNTMVFTHIPSNILLILVGFAPTLPLAIGLYLARMAISQMDVPTRQAYIVTVVREDERIAAAGITNVSRNVSQALSPSLTGYLLQSLPLLSAPFLLSGALKIVYDVALFLKFRNIAPRGDGKKSD